MTDKQTKIAGGILVGTAILNTIMCLNLYRHYTEILYKTSQLDSNINSAIQYLSNDVWEIKQTINPNSHNQTGQFE